MSKNTRPTVLAWLVAASAFTGCDREPHDPSTVKLHLAHSPMTTKDQRIVDVSLSNYEKVDVHKGQYRIIPGTTVRFSIPAKFLVSKWNLKGGPQTALYIQTRANTRDPWEDCVDREHGAPKLICLGEEGRLIVVHSALLPQLTPAFSPDRKTFPDRLELLSSMWKSRPGPKLGNYQVEYYDSYSSKMKPKYTGLVGDFDPYKNNFYMQPIDYNGKSIQIVDCNKIQPYCKAYLFYNGFYVTFAVEKLELKNVTSIAADVQRLLASFTR